MEELIAESVSFLAQFSLNYFTAALIDAVFAVSGPAAGSVVALSAGGIGIDKALCAIRNIEHEKREKGINCSVRKLPKAANVAIASKRRANPFEWFAYVSDSSVYVMYLLVPDGTDNAVRVGIGQQVVYDKYHKRVLRLIVSTSWACVGGGSGLGRGIEDSMLVSSE